MRASCLWLLSPLLVCSVAHAQPTDYTIDPKRSEVAVLVFKTGFASGMAHDHVIVAKDLKGSISYDSAKPAAIKVQATVQAASLVADQPAMTKKYKLTSSPSESDRKTIEESLKGADQLAVKTHPTISFKSKSATLLKGELYVTGTFTLRGKTKSISLLVKISKEKDGALRGKGSFTVKQSEFGYEPYSAFLGAVKVKDVVRVHLDLVAVPKKPSAGGK
jgi:polyisoprenoid-binding protein YceI